MHINEDIRLSVALKEGCVLYFKHDSFEYSEEPHFFVVLNKNKDIDDLLVLAYATSREKTIKKYMKFARPETFISVDPYEYPKFTCKTFFDCNRIHKITKAELKNKIKEGKCFILDPLPDNILSLIKAGVRISKTVEGAYKKIIYPDYDK
jgi:hypothetical protein